MKILFFPFIAIWKLVEFIFKAAGRLVAVILGFVLMALGIVLCLSVVGAVVGIPLCTLGFLLIVKGFF